MTSARLIAWFTLLTLAVPPPAHALRAGLEGTTQKKLATALQPAALTPAGAEEGGDGSSSVDLAFTEPQQAFEKIQRQIALKKHELLEWFQRQVPSGTEHPDQTQALARLDRLGGAAERLLAQGGKDVFRYPLFAKYLNSTLEPLLTEYDAPTLNYILASRGTSYLEMFLDSVFSRSASETYLNLSRERDPIYWDIAQRFYYLPGLPIVVEAVTPYHNRFFGVIGHGKISAESRQRLAAAARFITQSGWTHLMPETLQAVRSIEPLENYSGGGHSGEHGHIAINVARHPAWIAGSIVHEGRHTLNVARREAIVPPPGKDPRNVSVQHPWFSGEPGNQWGRLSVLLDELDAYAVFAQFLLHLWDTTGFDPLAQYPLVDQGHQLPSVIQELWLHHQRALEAIGLLDQHWASYRHKDCQQWLAESKERWTMLIPQIEGRWTQMIEILLASDNVETRGLGYTAVMNAWCAYPQYRKAEVGLVTHALSKESNDDLLKWFVSSAEVDLPAAVQEAAQRRLGVVEIPSAPHLRVPQAGRPAGQAGAEEGARAFTFEQWETATGWDAKAVTEALGPKPAGADTLLFVPITKPATLEWRFLSVLPEPSLSRAADQWAHAVPMGDETFRWKIERRPFAVEDQAMSHAVIWALAGTELALNGHHAPVVRFSRPEEIITDDGHVGVDLTSQLLLSESDAFRDRTIYWVPGSAQLLTVTINGHEAKGYLFYSA